MIQYQKINKNPNLLPNSCLQIFHQTNIPLSLVNHSHWGKSPTINLFVKSLFWMFLCRAIYQVPTREILFHSVFTNRKELFKLSSFFFFGKNQIWILYILSIQLLIFIFFINSNIEFCKINSNKFHFDQIWADFTNSNIKLIKNKNLKDELIKHVKFYDQI